MISAVKLSFSVVVASLFIPGLLAQLYMQPSKTEFGYFTNDSFFITCLTTDESADQLTWTGLEENTISTIGRIHVQPLAPVSGQKGLELVFESVQKEDAGRYTCSDTQNSIHFNLDVYRSISFGSTPKVQHAAEGAENARITCHAKADPAPTISWYFNGIKLTKSDKYDVEPENLLIHDVARADAGIYRCKAFVITHLQAQVLELDIDFQVQYAPEFWISDHAIYASFGSEANLTCTASANPEPMFQWMKNEEKIHNSSDHMIITSGNTSSLRFRITDREQFGDYVCSVSNTLGVQEKDILLKEGNVPDPPSVKVSSEDQGTLVLDIQEPDGSNNELPILGFKVQYILSTETWDQAISRYFVLGDTYMLKNMSYNSEYVFRAAASNVVGYSDNSGEFKYTTHTFQVAPVVADNGIGAVTISLFALILNAMVLWLH